MRIPTRFVLKSPDSSVRNKSSRLSSDVIQDKGALKGHTLPRDRSHEALPSQQKSPTALNTVASQTRYSDNSQADSARSPEVFTKSKATSISVELPAPASLGVDNGTALPVTNYRSQVIHKPSYADLQCDLSPIAENSLEEHLEVHKPAVVRSGDQMKLTEGNAARKKSYESPPSSDSSPGSKGRLIRRYFPKAIRRNIATNEFRTREIQDSGHSLISSDHEHSGNECQKPLNSTLGQGEPYVGSVIKRLPWTQDRLRQSCKISPRSYMSLSRDEVPAMSSTETEQSSSPYQTQKVIAPTKSSLTFDVENSKNTEFWKTYSDHSTDYQKINPMTPKSKNSFTTTDVGESDQNSSVRRLHDQPEDMNRNPKNEESGSTKHERIDLKPTLQTFRRNEYIKERIFMKQDSKASNELQNVRARITSTNLLEDDTPMAPPPFGYHVRRDFSNPDSNTELFKKLNIANSGDCLNSVSQQKPLENCYRRKLPSSDDTDSSHCNSEMWKYLLPRHRVLGKTSRSHVRECFRGFSGTDKCKRPAKLVIIGKLNSSRDPHKRKGNHCLSAPLVISGEKKNVLLEKSMKPKDKTQPGSETISWADPKDPKSGDVQTLKGDDKLTAHHDQKSRSSDHKHFSSMEDGIKCYYKVVNSKSHNMPGFYVKRHSRGQSVWKLSRGVCLKRVNGKNESLGVNLSKKACEKTVGSHPRLRIIAKTKNEPPGHKCSDIDDKLKTLRILSPCNVNANSNAGMSDTGNDGVPDDKTEIYQKSCTAIQNSQQLNCSQLDNEVEALDSDSEVSPSTSLTREGDNTVIVGSHQSPVPLLNVSKSCEQVKNHLQGTGETKQTTTHDVSENVSHKRSKKILEQTSSDKTVNIKSNNQVNRSQASMILPPKESHVPVAKSRHKRTNKTTEVTAVIHESVESRKCTLLTAVRDGSRVVKEIKPRQPREKQLPPAGDVQKAVSGALENFSKITPDSTHFPKMVNHSEEENERLDAKLKDSSCYGYPDSADLKEPNLQTIAPNNSDNEDLSPTESEKCYNPHKLSNTHSRRQDVNQIKRVVSLPKTMSPECFPEKPCLSANYYAQSSSAMEFESASKIESPKLNGSRISPVAQTAVQVICSQFLKMEMLNKSDKQNVIESPAKASSNSLMRTLNSSPKRELSDLQEKCEENEQSVPVPIETNEHIVKEIVSSSLQEPELEDVREAVSAEKSLASLNVCPGKVISNRKGSSPQHKLTGSATGHISRKVAPGKNADGHCSKDGNSGAIHARILHQLTTKKKRSVICYKHQSRSPESKKKKRLIRKGSDERDVLKSESVKKQKNVDKLSEKKKKKKKQKLKSLENMGEMLQYNHPITIVAPMLGGTTIEQRQTAETFEYSIIESSISKAIESNMLQTRITSRDKMRRSDLCRGGFISCNRTVHSLDRQSIWRSEDLAKTCLMSSSAENLSSPSQSKMPIVSMESEIIFASAAKTSARVVQIPTCPKVKKNEKDLQEAELGWNSHIFSNDVRVSNEKVKHHHKRAKVRYYIVKPQPKKSDKEVVASKLKRPASRPSLADGELDFNATDADAYNDGVPQERPKPGQGKSVQFSDNIEDLEASKEEAVSERPPRKPECDSILHHHPVTKTTVEALKPCNRTAIDDEVSVQGKLSPQKKYELRQQITPPRRRRPVWLKKSLKDKHAAVIGLGKSTKDVVTVKQPHSSECMMKQPSSRFSFQLFYPVKPGSPKLDSNGQIEKEKVSYNTWINNIFLATPLSKTTKKLVAKTGSPVDIKEIIEGSSVDATDHLKLRKSTHDAGVRAAKSVPSLGSHRGVFASDPANGKRIKASDDMRLVPLKKSRDVKGRECWSPRAYSVAHTREDQVTTPKNGNAGSDGSVSPDWSTNVDDASALKKKLWHARLLDHGSPYRKEKALGRKKTQESPTKWQLVATQNAQHVPELAQLHYNGDMLDLNIINMGLAWVVQRVVSRMPFLNPRQRDPAASLSKDMSPEQLLDAITDV